jgi:hypothetical protein
VSRRPIWGALLLVCACQGDRASVEVPTSAPAAPLRSPAAGPVVRSTPELCSVLTGVMAAETEGFAGLRARRLAGDSWLARATLPGTESCTIEGANWPRARYQCIGPPISREPASAARAFDDLARELAACLETPIWFPRDWQRGERFEFAMGERLQAWTDRTTRPASQVVLKVQQDAASDAYRVKLDLAAVP